LETSMPTNMRPSQDMASAARACGSGLALHVLREGRPQRLFGLMDLMADGAPHSDAGSLTPADFGLPSAATFAPRGESGN
jgi:hypothetical protein